MSNCLDCNRPLSVLESVIRGVGPICANKRDAENAESTNDVVDLSYNPKTKDITCQRIGDKQHFNIYQTIKHHSTSGMSWGYMGSGCADFALNILEHFVREFEQPTIKCWIGKCCRTSWDLHQEFKVEFVAGIGRDGGVIQGSDIRLWLNYKIKKRRKECHSKFLKRTG